MPMGAAWILASFLKSLVVHKQACLLAVESCLLLFKTICQPCLAAPMKQLVAASSMLTGIMLKQMMVLAHFHHLLLHQANLAG